SLTRARWRLARLLAAAGQESQAKGLLRDGLRLDPTAPQLHAELGRLYENRQQFRSAAAEWARATVLSPTDADSWYHLGVCAMGRTDESRAQRAYCRATELAPTSPTYRKALGGVLRLQRQYGEAESQFRRAVALDAHDPDAYFGLAKLLADRDGATAEAEQN